jgi:hypothetical protein
MFSASVATDGVRWRREEEHTASNLFLPTVAKQLMSLHSLYLSDAMKVDDGRSDSPAMDSLPKATNNQKYAHSLRAATSLIESDDQLVG